MNKNAHTCENIANITYKGLFEAGLGPDLDTIHEDIHVCTPDEGSNMLKAWGKIEGAGVFVIVNKTAWEQPFLLLVFYPSSRKSRRHVHIFTALKRYILPLSLSHLHVIVQVQYMHIRSYICYILFRNCLKLFIYAFVHIYIFINIYVYI